MKRCLPLLVACLLFSGFFKTANAQTDSVELKKAVVELDQALMKQDTLALARLLDKNVSFGHSNGWVQSKKEMLQDFGTGKVQYLSMRSGDLKIRELSKNWATLTLMLDAVGKAGDKEFKLHLHVLQVWKKDKKGWQLFARQGAKIE